MSRTSPLKQKPLRTPGQSLDDELTRLRDDTGYDYLAFTGSLAFLAFMEWYGYFFRIPRAPWLFTALAVITLSWSYYVLLLTALHDRRRSLLRRSRVLQPPAALLRADRPQDRKAHPPRPGTDADVRELFRSLHEAPGRASDGRHRPLQAKAGCAGGDHVTEGCEHLRFGVSNLSPLEGGIAEAARGMD